MQLSQTTINISLNCLMALALFCLVHKAIHTIADVPSHKERAEIERCQEGFTAACKKVIAMGDMK